MSVMEIDKVVDQYMAHIGMVRVKGHGADPLLPFLMLDVMYQIYTSDIKPVACKQELKRLKNQWLAEYTALNKDFFCAFDNDVKISVLDLMDSFEEFINNDVVIAKVQIVQSLPKEVDYESRKIVAAASICNVLTQAAIITWRNIYVDKKGEPIKHPRMLKIERLSSKWGSDFFTSKYSTDVNLNNSRDICLAVDLLCKKMVNWLNTQK